MKRPVNELFREVYTIPELNIQPPSFAGDCPVTRAQGIDSKESIDPEVTTLTKTSVTVADALLRALRPATDNAARAWIAYEPATSGQREHRKARERIIDLLRFAVSHGIVELCIPSQLLDAKDWADLVARAPTGFLARGGLQPDEPFHGRMPLPRLTILGAEHTDATTLLNVMRMDRPCHVVVAPTTTRDPRHSERALFDVTRHITLSDLVMSLQA